MLPPEYRQSASDEGFIPAFPSTDIYQMGLLIWRISRNDFSGFASQFCKMAGSTTKADTACTEPHADSVQLLPPGEDTPHYLRQIIIACRAENPDERPAAWELLEMFPPTVEDNTNPTRSASDAEINHPSVHQSLVTGEGTIEYHASPQKPSRPRPPTACTSNNLARLEECLEKYDLSVGCDICGKRTGQHYFSCKICALADSDICPGCFSRGGHCFDPRHLLREYSENDEEVLHTSVDMVTGRRERRR